MQFFLTDVGVGLAALLGYWSFGRLARHRAVRLQRRKPPAGKRGVPAEFLIVDPRRLVRLW